MPAGVAETDDFFPMARATAAGTRPPATNRALAGSVPAPILFSSPFMPNPDLSILVVDDEPIARHAVLRLLREDTGIEVVGADMELDTEALAAAAPDIVVAYGNDTGDGWTWWDDKLKDQVSALAPFVPVKLSGQAPD